MNSKTAILIFVRSVKEEIQAKKFYSTVSKNISFTNSLNQRIVSRIKSSGVAYYVINSEKQRGEDFSERFQNAFQDIFNLGYTNVISVGNDSPFYSKNILKESIEAIQKRGVVYGKTNKGGIYTLGFDKHSFSKFNFNNLSWQTESLAEDLENYAIRRGIPARLLTTELSELNTNEDILFFTSHIIQDFNCSLEDFFGQNFFRNHVSNGSISLNLIESINLYKLKFRGPPAIAA